MALVVCLGGGWGGNSFEWRVYIVELADNKGTGKKPIGAILARDDCLYGFSPDGRQLVISSQRIHPHNKRTVITIRLLDTVRLRTGLLRCNQFTIDCDESNIEGPNHHWAALIPLATCSRLAFAVWDGRWVAGLWEESKQSLALYDLDIRSHLTSLDLSTLDASGSGSKKVIFSGNLKFATSYERPTKASLARSERGKEKESDNQGVCVKVKTNQAICTLEDINLNDYWLSNFGQYLVVRQKNVLGIFRLSEF